MCLTNIKFPPMMHPLVDGFSSWMLLIGLKHMEFIYILIRRESKHAHAMSSQGCSGGSKCVIALVNFFRVEKKVLVNVVKKVIP